ncbi:hypothetical protein FO519_005658 [Halicephalobus sp. NKZ332]|nr:hypothetical protein FO519_005658 [Halicephalobus sp. NKZ332]
MENLWLIVGFWVDVVGGVEKTRVYNARATSNNGGRGEINIMVIQVGLTNFDETGHVITVPPPVMTVPDQIAHRVTWSPETGVVLRKEEPPESAESETLRKLEPEPVNNSPQKLHVPEYVSHYLSRQTTVPDPEIESRNFLATVIALAVGLGFLILLAYGISVFLHKKRKRKILERQLEVEMETIKTTTMNNATKNRPIASIPEEQVFRMDFDDLSYHDYENMSEVDEPSDFEVRKPPPVPPRNRTSRPPCEFIFFNKINF